MTTSDDWVHDQIRKCFTYHFDANIRNFQQFSRDMEERFGRAASASITREGLRYIGGSYAISFRNTRFCYGLYFQSAEDAAFVRLMTESA